MLSPTKTTKSFSAYGRVHKTAPKIDNASAQEWHRCLGYLDGTLQANFSTFCVHKNACGHWGLPHTIPDILRPTHLLSHRSLKTNSNKLFSLTMHLITSIRRSKNNNKLPSVNVWQLPNLYFIFLHDSMLGIVLYSNKFNYIKMGIYECDR